ncbi:MAG: hypothetical protein ABSC77_09045 [Terracidiphilus sp.]|jgi:hypothetical protein
MKRFVISAVLLSLCLAFPARSFASKEVKKETAVDMSKMNRIFVGWVDLDPEQWAALDFSTKAEWADLIVSLNTTFASKMQTQYLPGRTVVTAKNKGDEDTTGCDLYIKFSDVHVDKSTFGISLSIHFIDPKTGTEIASVPSHLYYEKRMWEFTRYMQAALEDVGKRVQAEVTGEQPKK